LISSGKIILLGNGFSVGKELTATLKFKRHEMENIIYKEAICGLYLR
jgi:hypothetical protein